MLPEPAPLPQQCSQVSTLPSQYFSRQRCLYETCPTRYQNLVFTPRQACSRPHPLNPRMFLLNDLLRVYSKLGEWDSARHLFDKMSTRNLISYNSLISGYHGEAGLFDKALSVFKEARMAGWKLDKLTYAGALSLCGQTGDFELGKLVHGLIVANGLDSEVFLTNSLIDMYSMCGQVDHARNLFQSSDNLDHVSWNSLTACYAQIGVNEETLTTLGSALKAFAKYLTIQAYLGKYFMATQSNWGWTWMLLSAQQCLICMPKLLV